MSDRTNMIAKAITCFTEILRKWLTWAKLQWLSNGGQQSLKV